MPRRGRAQSRKPLDQISAGMDFYARLGFDVRHFGPLWHLMKIAQLVETDLNRISSLHGLSIADFHFLSALMMEEGAPLTATDLAHLLNVSNAALSGRVRRLAEAGLVLRRAEERDGRTVMLHLTAQGAERVRAVAAAIEQDGLFVRYFRRLSPENRDLLGDLLGDLHTLIERHFLPVHRGDA